MEPTELDGCGSALFTRTVNGARVKIQPVGPAPAEAARAAWGSVTFTADWASVGWVRASNG